MVSVAFIFREAVAHRVDVGGVEPESLIFWATNVFYLYFKAGSLNYFCEPVSVAVLRVWIENFDYCSIYYMLRVFVAGCIGKAF